MKSKYMKSKKISLLDIIMLYSGVIIFTSFIMFQVIFWTASFTPSGIVSVNVDSIHEREIEMAMLGIGNICILITGVYLYVNKKNKLKIEYIIHGQTRAGKHSFITMLNKENKNRKEK